MSSDNQDAHGENFLNYIETHLQAKNCPSFCSRIWSVDDLLRKCVSIIIMNAGNTTLTTNYSSYY